MKNEGSFHSERALSPSDLAALARDAQAGPDGEGESPISFDRFEGMMLSLAIGDSLGNSSEAQLPAKRRQTHGEITGYLVHPKCGDARGYPSDDTQLSFWTLEHLLEHGMVQPEELARTFATRRIFGIGSTVRDFVGNFHRGLDWTSCGMPSAGNGALMRVAPLIYSSLLGRSQAVVAETKVATAVTHNDSMAIAASVAAVQVLMKCCRMERAPEGEWWASEFIRELREWETDFTYRSRSGAYAGFQGSLWQFLEQHLMRAYHKDLPLVELFDWYSGAYLLETVPCCLLILMKYGADPEQAMLRAVNDTKDNDTVAAIVGAFLGALHGRGYLPEAWLKGLSGRTREDDEGAVFRMLGEARAKWERKPGTHG